MRLPDLEQMLGLEPIAEPPVCFVCGASTGGRVFVDGDREAALALCAPCRVRAIRAYLLDAGGAVSVPRLFLIRSVFRPTKLDHRAVRARGRLTASDFLGPI